MKSKKSKKTFSIPVGIIIIVIIILIMVVLFVISKNKNTTNLQELYKSTNNIFSDSGLKSVDKNENHKSNKTIKNKDLKLGDIYCGMKLEDMISVLGECRDIYDGQGENYENLNYTCYRYDNYNILIDIDKDKKTIKRISYYGNDFETKRGIKIGTDVSEVIKSYRSEKNISSYENNYGTYKVLYNSDDVFDYLYNKTTDNKSLGYIYEYEGAVYKVEYVEDNMILSFDFLNNQVSHISMSYK